MRLGLRFHVVELEPRLLWPLVSDLWSQIVESKKVVNLMGVHVQMDTRICEHLVRVPGPNKVVTLEVIVERLMHLTQMAEYLSAEYLLSRAAGHVAADDECQQCDKYPNRLKAFIRLHENVLLAPSLDLKSNLKAKAESDSRT